MPNSQMPKSQMPKSQMPKSQFGTKTQTQTSTSKPNGKPINQNQEILVRENMVIGFYYFLPTDKEAYSLYFKSMDIQVSHQSLNDPRITHMISTSKLAQHLRKTEFGAILSGVWVLDASYIYACMKAKKVLTNFSDFEFWQNPFPPLKISEDLETLVGSKEGTEYFVAKKIRTYIKENNLIDPTNRQIVFCDDKLEKIVGQKKVKCCDMVKYLRPHMLRFTNFPCEEPNI